MDSSAAKGILERSGLTKVRHLDVNLLWLQEQAARDAVNLTKVPGGDNNADLMTKHLSQEVIKGHLQRMRLVYRGGRAEIAAKLQSSLKHKQEAKHLRAVKAEDRICKLEAERGSFPGGDRWQSRGAEGLWLREHRTPREALFTPCRVPRGLAHPDQLSVVRVTKGCFENGGSFTIRDNWYSGSAHSLLPGRWTGTTTFELRAR